METVIQKILVPCDFSDANIKVLTWACDLAKRYGATLTLFHVYQPPTYVVPPDSAMLASPEVLADQVTEMMDSLDDLKKTAESQGIEQVVTKLSQGLPDTEILQECKEGTYQLVIMGTHGRTGLKHVFLGSVAEKVVRKAPCPVLTIRIHEAE